MPIWRPGRSTMWLTDPGFAVPPGHCGVLHTLPNTVGGFVSRAEEVQRLLADRRSTFIVVSTLESVPVREAGTFMGLLPAKGFHLGGLVLNRVLPAYLLPRLGARRQAVRGRRAPGGPALHRERSLARHDPVLVERVLQEVGVNFNNLGVVARREASLRSDLSGPPRCRGHCARTRTGCPRPGRRARTGPPYLVVSIVVDNRRPSRIFMSLSGNKGGLSWRLWPNC